MHCQNFMSKKYTILSYDVCTSKNHSVWESSRRLGLKTVALGETYFVDLNINPLLTNLHYILVGNNLTKFNTLGIKGTTTRSNKEEILGKHVNNILVPTTNWYNALLNMIYYIFGSINLWDKLWSMA